MNVVALKPSAHRLSYEDACAIFDALCEAEKFRRRTAALTDLDKAADRLREFADHLKANEHKAATGMAREG
ncbi:MAG: hypothetical protein AAGB07_15630 [Pseudomonadota bacterium]